MSLFWWNRFPQNWQGYGLVSEWIKRWVLKVLERLNALPHCLHSNTFSAECTALCCVRLISWPNVLLHSSQANGLFPLWDLLACTYKREKRKNTFFVKTLELLKIVALNTRVWYYCKISTRYFLKDSIIPFLSKLINSRARQSSSNLEYQAICHLSKTIMQI